MTAGLFNFAEEIFLNLSDRFAPFNTLYSPAIERGSFEETISARISPTAQSCRIVSSLKISMPRSLQNQYSFWGFIISNCQSSRFLARKARRSSSQFSKGISDGTEKDFKDTSSFISHAKQIASHAPRNTYRIKKMVLLKGIELSTSPLPKPLWLIITQIPHLASHSTIWLQH